jgi:choline kinase
MINLNNYSVVLLSAGIGRRLGTLGKKYPKCLLKINNKTLIELLLGKLKKRNAKRISMIVGYKSQMLIKFLKKVKGIKINFIKIGGYKINGHSYSWFKYRNQWLKEKKPLVLIHADIHFDPIYLDNIMKSKKNNIIGIKHKTNHKFKRNTLKEHYVVKIDKKNKIKQINPANRINKPQGEIIGINKFSKETTGKIFKFMEKFFAVGNKALSWEIFLNHYIQQTKESFFVLKNQSYSWININTFGDYLKAKMLKFD